MLWRDTGPESAKVTALAGILVLLRDENHRVERHFASAIYNEPTQDHGRITVTTDGHGVASHAGPGCWRIWLTGPG